jgi:MOSC domain-containing protein YiiM
MTSSDEITIGPYVFTAHDAVRTLANVDGILASTLAGRTSRAAEAIAADLLRRLSSDSDLRTRLATAWQGLRDLSDALRTDGQMPGTATGTVTQLSLSKGGVPKLPTDSVEVGFRGVLGDVQRMRVHHGRPWQALCIYADEVIDMLRAEGHPIGRGSVGENITVAGLDWAQVRPGVMLRIGEVLTHVQAYAEPCNTNARFFLGGDFNRMNADRGPVSRVYATVLQPGSITTGDRVTLEPALTGTIEELTAQPSPA